MDVSTHHQHISHSFSLRHQTREPIAIKPSLKKLFDYFEPTYSEFDVQRRKRPFLYKLLNISHPKEALITVVASSLLGTLMSAKFKVHPAVGIISSAVTSISTLALAILIKNRPIEGLVTLTGVLALIYKASTTLDLSYEQGQKLSNILKIVGIVAVINVFSFMIFQSN